MLPELSRDADPVSTHRLLAASHAGRLRPSADTSDIEERLQLEMGARLLEHWMIEAERTRLAPLLVEVPTTPTEFVNWFETLRESGPGQNDPLFPWLAQHASYEQMCWFLRQEMAGEAGFEDLVALSQLKLPARAKLEMARNYWDEMGQGHQGGMHGPMLEQLAAAIPGNENVEIVWEALALSNLMVALATARHYAFQAIGALGAIELTAPGRCELVNAGLKRLGVGGAARRYYALHAQIDIRHSAAWNSEVLWSLVASAPELAKPLAEGALLRLSAGARCFQRYRAELMP